MAKNWRDSIPSKWLKAANLEGKPRLLTIKRFSVEKIAEDKTGPVIWFVEEQKGLGLNITNGRKIEEICGSPDPDKWIGKRIVVYPTETELRGETVDCIRIRAPKPGAKLPPPPPLPEPEDVEGEQGAGTDDPFSDDSVPF